MNLDDFPSHCGSTVLHDFASGLFIPLIHKSEYRTIFSIFINRPDQKKAYDALTQKFKILYQSPVLKNPNTNREYFIVIFLNESP